MAVDWTFIAALEGCELKGYVPDSHGSRSGVTIATGVDLGQLTAAELDGWSIAADLKDKLKPYCGQIRDDAVACLKARPLTLSQAECDALAAVVQGSSLALVRRRYDATRPPPPTRFDDMPDRAQTVIASVAFQYGDLAARCPHFWALAVVQDWPRMIAQLRNFGDKYPTRRNKEADYLRPLVPPPNPVV
jgi:hypothetical protein